MDSIHFAESLASGGVSGGDGEESDSAVVGGGVTLGLGVLGSEFIGFPGQRL